eukprot:gene20637-biopygen2590
MNAWVQHAILLRAPFRPPQDIEVCAISASGHAAQARRQQCAPAWDALSHGKPHLPAPGHAAEPPHGGPLLYFRLDETRQSSTPNPSPGATRASR